MRCFHKNSFIDVYENAALDKHFLDSTHMLINLFLSNELIEERRETLIHDKTSYWSAVGGNLGLVLGFSCLPVAHKIFDLMERLCCKYSLNE